jgi:hypothetical protein
MNIFKSILLHSSGPSCRHCAHFEGEPALIEEAYPGLNIMSSGYASVRDRDGICHYHEVYLSGRDSCACFAALDVVAEQAHHGL